MANLLIHPATNRLLDAYRKAPAHALCLSGDEGAGLGSIAQQLATDLSGSAQTVTLLAPEKGLISIERVRHLYEQTRSIQRGKRCIILDDADAMSHDAQNALLKLLEEPVENVHFILTTHHPSRLLETIRSRTQNIDVRPLDETMSKQLLTNYELSPTQQVQALFLASGKPAELTRLAENPEYFSEQTTVVTDARALLQAGDYDRLAVIKKYTDRTAALRLLSMCAKLLSFSLLRQRNYSAVDVMPVLETVMRRIEGNGHVRTHLAYLVTKLP